VGQNAKINLSELTGKFVGKPWEKFSCIGLMHDFYTDIGIDVPDNFGGIALDDAISEWRNAPARAISVMLSLFKTLGEKGNTKYPSVFDVLVIRRRGEIFPAIALPGGRFMTSTLGEGVIVGSIGEDLKVIMARRMT